MKTAATEATESTTSFYYETGENVTSCKNEETETQ